MPEITYNYLAADECPAVQLPAGLLVPADGAPVNWEQIGTGEAGASGLAKLNRNFVRSAGTGRHGGGGYAVAAGLDLESGNGLTLTITPGLALIDGPVVPPAAQREKALTDNIDRIYLWLSRAGTVTPVNDSLTPPEGAQAFLGSAKTASGAITELDYSGRMELRGGYLWRRTGDEGVPADEPPADAAFLQVSGDALYLWLAGRYWLLGEPEAPPEEGEEG